MDTVRVKPNLVPHFYPLKSSWRICLPSQSRPKVSDRYIATRIGMLFVYPRPYMRLLAISGPRWVSSLSPPRFQCDVCVRYDYLYCSELDIELPLS